MKTAAVWIACVCSAWISIITVCYHITCAVGRIARVVCAWIEIFTVRCVCACLTFRPIAVIPCARISVIADMGTGQRTLQGTPVLTVLGTRRGWAPVARWNRSTAPSAHAPIAMGIEGGCAAQRPDALPLLAGLTTCTGPAGTAAAIIATQGYVTVRRASAIASNAGWEWV